MTTNEPNQESARVESTEVGGDFDLDEFLVPGGALRSRLWEETGGERSGLQPGARVGPYRIIERLGAGGMATVYLAARDDGQFDQEVAIKLVRRGAGPDELISRFELERQILARLAHPCIARLLDGGITEDGQPYFVLEAVAGEPIDTFCDRRRLTLEARLQLFLRAASAVQYAHGNLVVHRDIKPANLLVTADGDPKLLDFGIAKILQNAEIASSSPNTRTGLRLMTPEYASPEQVLGQSVTVATDVYQLGVLLYQLLTGRRPFSHEELAPRELERAICERPPDPPSRAVQLMEHNQAARVGHDRGADGRRLIRWLRGDLDNIVLKALRKEPERRYSTVKELIDDLNNFLTGKPVRARRDTVGYRLGKFVARHRMAVTLLASAALIMAGVIGVYTWRLNELRLLAEERAATAEQVTFFVSDIFEGANPFATQGGGGNLRALLERGADRIEADLEDQPEVQLQLYELLGNIYAQLGEYERAVALLTRARQSARTLNDRAAEARVLAGLGTSQHDAGDTDTALLSLDAAVENLEALTNADPAIAARVWLGRAIVQRESGRIDQAETSYVKALALYARAFGPESLESAEAMFSYAIMLIDRDRRDEAAAVLEEVVRIRRHQLGPDHLLLASPMDSLGNAHRIKNPSRAEDYFLDALALREAHLEPGHPDIANSHQNLSNHYRNVGDFDAALEHAQRSLDIRLVHFGPNHDQTGAAWLSLGTVYNERTEFDRAEEAFMKALAIFDRPEPPYPPALPALLNNLALIPYQQGRLDDAIAYLERGIEVRTALYGEGTVDVARMRSNTGLAQAQAGRCGEAEPNLRRALEVYAAELGEDHANLAWPILGLAECANQRQDSETAVRWLERAVGVRVAGLGEGHSLTAEAVLQYGEVLLEAGRLDEALGQAQRALAIVREAVAETHLNRGLAHLLMGRVLLASGDRAGAEPHLVDAIAVLEQVSPARPEELALAKQALGQAKGP